MATNSTSRPPVDERKVRVTDESRAFKKSTQEVRPNDVIDHNMHDDLMRNPHRNVPEGWQPGGTVPGMKAPTNSELMDHEEGIPDGAMGERILGREQREAIERHLIDESEATV